MKHQEQLINKAAAGDQKAFEELYKSTYKKVHFTCMAFLKNEQDVADIEQDIYIIVLKSLNTLEDKSKFESWLGKITVNKCRDFLKKNKPILVEEEVLAEEISEDDELKLPEEYVSNKAKRKVLMDIIRDCLSDNLYQTVILFYFHDLSAAEIAEIMECPVGTITSRLCLARAKIKEAVLAYEKKSGDKLHAIVLVPVLGMLFKEEAMAMEPEYLCGEIIKASSTKLTATKVAETGGKIMLKSLKMKIMIAATAVVLVGGGITAVVMNQSDDSKDTIAEYSDDETSVKEDKGNQELSDVINDESMQGVDSNVEDTEKVEITEIGTKLVDNELVTIEYNGVEWDENENYRIHFTVTNKFNEVVSVEVNRYFSINGLQYYPGAYEKVEPGATIDYLILIGDYTLEYNKIGQVDYLDFTFGFRPQETGGITNERVQIIPEGSVNGAKPQRYEACDTDEVLIDTDEYYLVVKGYREDKHGTLYIDYYFQNNTDMDVDVGVYGETKINGETIRGFSTTNFVFGGNGINEYFDCSDVDEKVEGEIKLIETEFTVYNEEFEYDYEKLERKVVFRQPITIEKIFENE